MTFFSTKKWFPDNNPPNYIKKVDLQLENDKKYNKLFVISLTPPSLFGFRHSKARENMIKSLCA